MRKVLAPLALLASLTSASAQIVLPGGGSGGAGSGTVTTLSIVTANGVSGSVANPTTTPAVTLTLGAITPTTVAGSDTTDSTSATTGALKTAGGLGIVKNLFVGNNVNLPAASSTSIGNLVSNSKQLFAIGTGNYFWGGGNYSLSGSYNVGIGSGSTGVLASLTTGIGNVGFGYNSLTACTTCTYNAGLGYNTLAALTVAGTGNLAIGASSLSALTAAGATGNYNTAVGYGAGDALTTGSLNTLIGQLSGSNYTGAESNNTILGPCGGTAGESATLQFCDGGGALRFDYAHTTAGTLTVPVAATFSSATIKLTALANAAANEIVCYASGTGLLTYEPSVATCVPSDPAVKNRGPNLDSKTALAMLEQIEPGSGAYKPEVNLGTEQRIWLYADQVCNADARLCVKDSNGILNYDKTGMLAVTVAAVKQLQAEIDELKKDARR